MLEWWKGHLKEAASLSTFCGKPQKYVFSACFDKEVWLFPLFMRGVAHLV
jgi:hypothetical protein